MTTTNDSAGWQIWRWLCTVGAIVLGAVVLFRFGTDALRVADRGIDAYERAHSPILQKTISSWRTGDSRQRVETNRGPDQDLESWIDYHGSAVLASELAASERESLRSLVPKPEEQK